MELNQTITSAARSADRGRQVASRRAGQHHGHRGPVARDPHPAWSARHHPRSDLDEPASIESACAWITWSEIDAIIAEAGHQFSNPDASVVRAVQMRAGSIRRAIAWHT